MSMPLENLHGIFWFWKFRLYWIGELILSQIIPYLFADRHTFVPHQNFRKFHCLFLQIFFGMMFTSTWTQVCRKFLEVFRGLLRWCIIFWTSAVAGHGLLRDPDVSVRSSVTICNRLRSSLDVCDGLRRMGKWCIYSYMRPLTSAETQSELFHNFLRNPLYDEFRDTCVTCHSQKTINTFVFPIHFLNLFQIIRI